MSKNLSIVLVDDSKCVIAQLLKLIAGTEGVEVVGTACDGPGALRVVEDLKPDLVLMDISMPGLDGMSALRALGSEHPEVRVAMMSSVAGMGSCADEAVRLGAVQVISKPFDTELLASLFEGERKARGFSACDGEG
jgi:two-component system chemotaxis response regulator CheY